MKNNLNKKLIGLMAVGITAGLMVCPMHVSANENDPESIGENDPDSLLSSGVDDLSNNGSPEDNTGDPAPDDETLLGNSGDTSSNDGSSGDGTGDTSSNDGSSGGETGDASSNDGSSGDGTGDASSTDEPAVVDTGDHVADLIDGAEESATAAEAGFESASDHADQAIQELGEFNQNPSSLSEGEAAVERASEMISEAREEYAEASEQLENAEKALDEAGELLQTAEDNQTEIEAQLEAAKKEQETLESEVMANQEAADYYEDVLKSYEGLEESGFQKILESQEDLAATDKSDPLYSVLQDNVANNIMQYYILDSEEENLSDVSFQHVRDKYVEYYDSNNRPIDGDISYWIVEYKTPDGNVYQRRYQYNVDSDGDFSFNSLEIFPDATFESTSGTAVEKKQYVPTENTHAYEIKQDDGTRMLYAIDTATDTPVGIDIADEPKDESKPLKHEKGSTSKKYEKVEGSTTQDIVYKFSEDGKKIEEISIVEYQKYNINNIVTEQIGPVTYYRTYEEAETAAARIVNKYTDDAHKPQNVDYVYEISKLTRNRLWGATSIIKKVTTNTYTDDIKSKTTTYKATEYQYVSSEEKSDLTLAHAGNSLGSTKDSEFQVEMSQHKDAVTNAAEAKKEYQTAKQDLDESIKKLDDVNNRIEKLEAELLTDEEINRLQNEHTIALARVDSAQDAKNQAAQKIRQAETALQRSENIVQSLRNRNNDRIDGRGDVADNDGGFDERGDVADNDGGFEERGDVADTDGIIQREPGNALSNDNYTITGASEVLRKEAALNGASDSAAEDVYELVVRYQKTGINALKEKASTLLSSLPPTSKVRLYIMLARDYYMKNVNNPDFKFFNAEKYLEKYTDVKSAAIDSGEKDLKTFALNHYLTRGIFEDRSSMTDFDPIKQIYANPSKFNEISLEDPALPEAVFNLYTK